jgi:hypothetical protein
MTEPPSPPPEPNPYQPGDPSQPPQPPQPPYSQPGQYQQPYGAGYGQAQPAATATTSNDAIVALVLALCAWFVCPLVLAVIALVFAGKAKRTIEASNGWVTGDGMVTAARVIAWINIGLTLVALAFVVVVLIAAAVSSSGSVSVN